MAVYDKNKKYAIVEYYYALTLNELDMDFHAHNRFEIMYVTEGSCVVQFHNKDITLTQKQFIFIPDNIEHKLTFVSPELCKMMCIEVDRNNEKLGLDLEQVELNSWEFNYFCKNVSDYIVLNDTNNLCYALKDLVAELHEGNKGSAYMQQIMLARVLIGLARCYYNNHNSNGILYINKAKEYIANNLYEDMTVAGIAEQVGINKSYLQALFQKYFSCGVISYVNAKRMEKAKHLLINSKKSISQIALETGFNSRQHFCYIFKKSIQQSPMQYRKIKELNLNVSTRTFEYKKISAT